MLTSSVQLGNSGLKVSKIILGCMSYGSPEWRGQEWLLPEKDGMEQIKFACVFPLGHVARLVNNLCVYSYDAGINAFDTASVRVQPFGALFN
jgi:aryl-alcohol dehydrogenase-like predicted oxidoreductase